MRVSVTTDFGRALGSHLGIPCRLSAQVGAQYGRLPIDAVCTTELYCGVANAPTPFLPPNNERGRFFSLPPLLTQRILATFPSVPDRLDTSTHASARPLCSPLSKYDTDHRPHMIPRGLLTASGQPHCMSENAALLLCLLLQPRIPMETTNAIRLYQPQNLHVRVFCREFLSRGLKVRILP